MLGIAIRFCMIIYRWMIEQPVSIFAAVFPNIAVSCFFSYIFHPGFHALILIFKEILVAIYHVHSPWDNNTNITPAGRRLS